MKRTIGVIGVLLVLALLTGCLGTNGEDSTYQVSGKVTVKGTEEGLEDVNMVYPGGTTKTGKDGSWTLTGLSGTITIEAQKDSWEFTPPSVTVNKAQEDIDFTAEEIESTPIEPGSFADPALEAAVRQAVGKPTEELTKDDLQSITFLGVYGLSTGSLGGIESLTNLDWLHMSGGILTDFASLAKLPALRRLCLNHLQITDITGLSELSNVTHLEVTFNNVTDLEPLRDLHELRTLILWQNEITDLKPLQNLPNLGRLVLWGNNVSNLEPLKNLDRLYFLDLDGNPISDLNPLADLTNLVVLNLDKTGITSIAPIEDLTALQELYIGGNPDLKFAAALLKNLPNLTKLGVGGALSSQDLLAVAEMNNLTEVEIWGNQEPLEIEPLSNLAHLSVLVIQRTDISDPVSLSKFTELTDLILHSAGFSYLTPISQLTKLEWLALTSNGITDLGPLQGLINLQQLYLHDNEISDISPLLANEGFGPETFINLQRNPLSEQAIIDIGELESKGVVITYEPLSPAGFSMHRYFEKDSCFYVYRDSADF